MHPTSVYLTVSDRAFLDKLREITGIRSVSEVVRMAIREAVRKREGRNVKAGT